MGVQTKRLIEILAEADERAERLVREATEAERKRWADRLRLLIGRYRAMERFSHGSRTPCAQVAINLEEIIEDLTK